MPTHGCAIRASALDEILQTDECIVPLGRDRVQMPACFSDAPGLESPDGLSSMTRMVNETGIFHDPQVFGDGLPRHVEGLSQLRNRRRSVVTQARHQSQPGFVAEREKDGGRVRDIRRRRATPSGQGTSR